MSRARMNILPGGSNDRVRRPWRDVPASYGIDMPVPLAGQEASMPGQSPRLLDPLSPASELDADEAANNANVDLIVGPSFDNNTSQEGG